jgi:hypothetical protein
MVGVLCVSKAKPNDKPKAVLSVYQGTRQGSAKGHVRRTDRSINWLCMHIRDIEVSDTGTGTAYLLTRSSALFIH